MSADNAIALIAVIMSPIGVVIGALIGSHLQQKSVVKQIHYAKFHERRAVVLEELYKLVVESRRAFPLNVPIGNREKLNEQGYEFIYVSADLRKRYEEKAVWLDDEIKRCLDRFLEETENLALQLGRLSESEPAIKFGELRPVDLRQMAENDPDAAAEFHSGFQEMLKDRKRIADELESVRVAIETEFRKTLKGESDEEAKEAG